MIAIEYTEEFFYRVPKPDEKERLLASKTADMVNKIGILPNKMTQEELLKYWKPIFEECGLEWRDTPIKV
jgi:hypothetical protein